MIVLRETDNLQTPWCKSYVINFLLNLGEPTEAKVDIQKVSSTGALEKSDLFRNGNSKYTTVCC